MGEKLNNESTNIKSVWDILYEIYDLEITTTNFLDYALMSRESEESYRSYFNRLVGFVRQHLPKQEFKAEGVSSLPTGDILTIALLDTIAIHWLVTIDKRLVNIVKTEFATELKSKRLCQMVKVIAPNIDELLSRYSTKDQVSIVRAGPTPSQLPVNKSNSAAQDIASLVQRIERLETNFPNKSRKKKGFSARKRDQCTHGLFINKQLGSSLSTDHASNMCGKKNVSISLVQSMGDSDNSSSSQKSSDYGEGDLQTYSSLLTDPLQNAENCPADVQRLAAVQSSCVKLSACYCSSNSNCETDTKFTAVSEPQAAINTGAEFSSHDPTIPHITVPAGKNSSSDVLSQQNSVTATLNQSSFSWQELDKSRSPKI